MALFQKSVTNKYLKNLDTEKVDKAFENFQKFYGDKLRLSNIMQLKEENYQEGFLREIFVETLGYTINPDKDYNLTTEFKNQKDARKADGAILKNEKAIGVIELKSTKTKNLESIKEQAFGYKNNQPDCKYVITSNFQSLRFYIDNATEYEEFNLFQINKEQFKLLYLLLSQESIFSDLPEKLKQETKFHENNISDKLYKDYKQFKDKIFENLVKNNPEYDKLTLFKKSQKLLDRFLFIFFAEDSGLIPPNAVSKIVEQWKDLQELDEYKPLYSRFQKLFTHLDKGHVYKKWGEIPAYNGGLFRNDELLDTDKLKIDDEILEKDSLKLSKYDFNTEVDVNILGHIFEHSLNEIDEITAELNGEKIDKKKSKRKKDGVFYTPKYITKYIVENTVGTLCKEKKEELQINNLLIDESYFVKKLGRTSQRKVNEKGKKLFKTLNDYKDWLFSLKILDPACGSGAFLNQTLDFLIAEHKQIDDLIAELTGDAIRMFDTDKAILEKNIYGVDINEESVEIAKLSLWLRTAQRGRPLSDLSGNIKCGNSLIDDPEVAGEKAFNWEKEFPHVFNPKMKEKNYQKAPETKPDYAKLIKEKAQKAEKLAKEALEISKQVYEYANKISSAKEPQTHYGTKKGGFDVVIGNPPYVQIKNKNDFKNKYETIQSGDLYAVFFEKGINILKDNGLLGFITPSSYMTNIGFLSLRNFLLKYDIKNLIDLGENVFKDASVDSAIITIRKKISKKNKIITGTNLVKFKSINQSVFKEFSNNIFNIYTNKRTLELANKLNKKNLLLENFIKFSRGVEFGFKSDKVLDNKLNENYVPIICGGNISKNNIRFENKYIFHDINNPKIYKSKEIFEKEKILIRRIGNTIIGTYDNNGFYNVCDVYNLQLKKYDNYKLKVISLILNSKLINFYYDTKFKSVKKLFPKIPIQNLKLLPIPKFEKNKEQPFIEKADLMLSLNKELQTKADKFIKRIKSNLEIQKITNKLQNFYDFDFKTFVSELKKQKIKLTFTQQDEWEDYFDNYKTEINNIQNQINQTDKEIDNMVYELYELKTEEIEIVENSVK